MGRTVENLEDRAELERLEIAIRRARAQRAQFLRSMTERGKRLETQRLCVLGRAVSQLCEENNAFHPKFLSYLAVYVTRPTDRAALAGSRFDTSMSEHMASHEDDDDTHSQES